MKHRGGGMGMPRTDRVSYPGRLFALAGAFSSNRLRPATIALALSGVPPLLTVDLIGGFHTVLRSSEPQYTGSPSRQAVGASGWQSEVQAKA